MTTKIKKRRPYKSYKTKPLKEIDVELLERMASRFASVETIALILRVDPKTLENRFSEVIKRGRAVGKWGLHQCQFEAAMKGNVTAQIWMGKQYLGQSDKMEYRVSETSDLEFVTNLDAL